MPKRVSTFAKDSADKSHGINEDLLWGRRKTRKERNDGRAFPVSGNLVI
jgi:hypothetical protein